MICGELGAQLLHTGSGDCEAKGSIERWHRTLREELLDELGPEPLSLGDLNSKLWAWLGAEYHAREHDTTKRRPHEHLLEQQQYLRSIPAGKNLDEVFLHRERRKVRKDGTVRWQGGLLEVRPELVGEKVELRFDPSEESLPRVFVKDRFFCDTVRLDRLANASRPRRRIQRPVPQLGPSGWTPWASSRPSITSAGAPWRPTPTILWRRRHDRKETIRTLNYPFPKAAQGKTFFDKSPGYARLGRSFQHLVEEPGLATLCADAGLGKTAAMRHLCSELPQPDYQVIYLCDTTIAPVDLYRALAIELGVRPSHRRSQVWADLKKALLHLVDERGTHPIVVIDEAQNLSDAFLMDLSGFLNFAFDSRELFTLWLVGLPALSRRLHQLQHAALLTRVATEQRLEPLVVTPSSLRSNMPSPPQAPTPNSTAIKPPKCSSARAAASCASQPVSSAPPCALLRSGPRPSSTSPSCSSPSTRWGRAHESRTPSSQPLPSTSDLCVSPELAVLAVLQSTLRVTSQVLDIQNPLAGTLEALIPDPDVDAILAQIIIDRCRELSELVSSYRTLLLRPPSWLPDGLRQPVF